MKVSVIMCVYNTIDYIEEAVNSILEQTYDDFELVISDDCSTDGTRAWLKRLEGHPKVRLFFQQRNLGYVANKNFAISQARGEFITQNDSDDLSDSRRLEKQVAVLEQFPGVKIVACGYHIINDEGQIFKTVGPDQSCWIKENTGFYPFWYPSTLFHKDVYHEIGSFVPHFVGMGDDMYWMAKANEKYRIFCLKDPLYKYRYNPTSITNNLNDERKLIVPALLEELLRQRKQRGTDWIEENDLTSLKDYEQNLLSSRKFMGEQYRVWAAKSIDKRDFPQSKELLAKAFRRNIFNTKNFVTLLYLLRKRYLSKTR